MSSSKTRRKTKKAAKRTRKKTMTKKKEATSTIPSGNTSERTSNSE